MRQLSPAVTRHASDNGRIGILVKTLLDESVVFYLAAVTAQKTWLLLNADLFQLVRRVH
jgi:hypothetical protein